MPVLQQRGDAAVAGRWRAVHVRRGTVDPVLRVRHHLSGPGRVAAETLMARVYDGADGPYGVMDVPAPFLQGHRCNC